MNSPAAALQELVQDFQSQRRDRASFLDGLDQIDQYVNFFRGRLQGLLPPPDAPDAEAVRDCVAGCLDNYAHAVEELRRFAEDTEAAHLDEVARLTHEADQALFVLLNETREAAAQNAGLDGLAG